MICHVKNVLLEFVILPIQARIGVDYLAIAVDLYIEQDPAAVIPVFIGLQDLSEACPDLREKVLQNSMEPSYLAENALTVIIAMFITMDAFDPAVYFVAV